MGRAKYPLIPGHEWAGVVEDTGDGVATQVGADVIVNTTHQDLLATAKDMAQERGVDYVIEASGSVALAAMASSLTKNAGVINTLGIYTTKVPEFDLANIVLRDITLSGSVASPNVYEATLRLMGAGRIQTGLCISHRFGLKDVTQAMTLLDETDTDRIKVMLYPEGLD